MPNAPLNQRSFPARQTMAAAGLLQARQAGYKGWACSFIANALEQNRIVVPISGIHRATVSSGNILKWRYKGPQAVLRFINAAESVLQGVTDKEVTTPADNTGIQVAANANVVTMTKRAIGLVVRWSDTWNSSDYRPIPIAIAAGGTNYTVVVYPSTHMFDFVTFFVSSNVGEASLISSATATATVASNAARAGSIVVCETINLRDL